MEDMDLFAEAEALKPPSVNRCFTCQFIASRPEAERPKWRALVASRTVRDDVKAKMIAKRGTAISGGAIGNCRRDGHS